MSGRHRDRSGSEDQDAEASAGAQQSGEATAEANESPDSEGAGWAGTFRDEPRPNVYSGGYGRGRYNPGRGEYYDATDLRDERRRPPGRFGERAYYDYDERRYDYGPTGRAPDEGDWGTSRSDAVASWLDDKAAERGRSVYERTRRNRGKGPKNYRRSDERIIEEVSDRLSDDYYVDASDIEVQAEEGLVVLTGTVSNREEKRRAESLAEFVSGVREVENRIRVRPREEDLVIEQTAATSDEASFLDVLGAADRESNINLRQTVREAIQEESVARNYVTARYRSLIDRKYLGGLSPGEENELEALTVTLEEMDQPYYEAIGERLRSLLDRS